MPPRRAGRQVAQAAAAATTSTTTLTIAFRPAAAMSGVRGRPNDMIWLINAQADIAQGELGAVQYILAEGGGTAAVVDEPATNTYAFAQMAGRALLRESGVRQQIACKKGCRWCCAVPVTVCAAEALYGVSRDTLQNR
jgi:hypothetical protein